MARPLRGRWRATGVGVLAPSISALASLLLSLCRSRVSADTAKELNSSSLIAWVTII